MSTQVDHFSWTRFAAAVVGLGLGAGAASGCIFSQCDDMAMSGEFNGQTDLPPGDAGRVIAEADIVQIVDDRLYALSRTRGLNIVDVSDPDDLVLLDQADPVTGIPFEMYVRDGVVLALVDAAAEGHHTTLQAYDVSDPSAIDFIGINSIPGHVSDSRIVGDVLYVISFEDHSCSSCPSEPTTTVTSFSVGVPTAIERVDQLSYVQPDVDGQAMRRSVAVTTERMYVSGVDWDGGSQLGHSTIQVIDISAPDGQLVEGASVEVEGMILSRWQMDERDGVLRVVSQPGVWSSAESPRVETFAIHSSQEIYPLGSLMLELPVPESLRSVRFDGNRAYAITAAAPEPYDPTPGSETEGPPPPPVDSCGPSCDPLFVIDLTDPSQPVQLGSLEMPGWVFHMEPRGDRLMAFGFESTYPLGPLSVSLFDVADGENPKLLERVSFGGQWAGTSEDQNRIHKAFTMVDDLGLILVPYGYWAWQENMQCAEFESCGGDMVESCWDEGDWVRRGAVQIVHFTSDTLVARGAPLLKSWTRRAMIHSSRLLAVSDEEVSSFDIDNLDVPSTTSHLSF